MADQPEALKFPNLAADLPTEQIYETMASIFGRPADGIKKDAEIDHPEKWDRLWKSDYIPWDQGTANPTLAEALTALFDRTLPALPADDDSDSSPDTTLPTSANIQAIGPAKNAKGRRLRALVPGCGRGYDVFFLASLGFDAVGLDVSPDAHEKAKALAATLESAGWPGYPVVDADVGRGSAQFRVGDFFSTEWETEQEQATGWDIIFDYTFLCALPPAVRPKWAGRMSSLIGQSGGYLICDEFPTFKDPLVGGPPWGLSPVVYLEHLKYPGVEIEYDTTSLGIVVPKPGTMEVPADGPGPLTRILHWKARKAHPRGQGTNWIGIWARK